MMGIFATLTLFLMADHFLNRRMAILAALIFYFTPSVGILSTFASHDLTLTFFELLSVFALFLYLETSIKPALSNVEGHRARHVLDSPRLSSPKSEARTRRERGRMASSLPDRLPAGRQGRHGIKYLILSALLCGLAMGTKYTGLYFFATMILFIVFKSVRNSLFTIHQLLLFSVISFLPSSPWFIKNIINTGNPVYPAFSNIFGVKTYQKVTPGGLSKLGFKNPIDFILLPFRMTLRPEGFGSASHIGPLYLIFIPITLFLRKFPRIIKDSILISGILFLFWSLTLANTRYYLMGIALLALVSAYLITRLMEKGRVFRVLTLSILSISIFFNFYQTVSLVTALFNPIPVALGLQSKENYLSERLGYYPVTAYANENLSEDAKIFFLGETRTYYTHRKTLSSSAYDKTLLLEMIRSSGNLQGLLENLKGEGVTHVLYNEQEAGFLAEKFNYFDWKSPEEKEIYDAFTKNHLKILFSKNGVYLLEIVY
jgi:4-amino-4-deoxy-L-arabinose transferase-like glycosyltransferase